MLYTQFRIFEYLMASMSHLAATALTIPCMQLLPRVQEERCVHVPQVRYTHKNVV